MNESFENHPLQKYYKENGWELLKVHSHYRVDWNGCDDYEIDFLDAKDTAHVRAVHRIYDNGFFFVVNG